MPGIRLKRPKINKVALGVRLRYRTAISSQIDDSPRGQPVQEQFLFILHQNLEQC